MNLWECEQPGCTRSVVGCGGAVGLRAIGWWFEPGPGIRCPVHRPDLVDCRDRPGVPCPLCAADAVAKEFQATMWTAADQTGLDELANQPMVIRL